MKLVADIFKVAIALIGISQTVLFAEVPALGGYKGRCQNTTFFGISAAIEFVLTKKIKDDWNGEMVVHFPLSGSGKATCRMIEISSKGKSLQVFLIEPKPGSISWYGIVSGNTIAGTYYVKSTGEEGRFSLEYEDPYKPVRSAEKPAPPKTKSDISEYLDSLGRWFKDPQNQQNVLEFIRGAYNLYAEYSGGQATSSGGADTVTVRPYVRSDGTPVRGYTRSAPGSGPFYDSQR